MRPRVGRRHAASSAPASTRTDVEETEYLALVLGDVTPDEPVLVRVQTAELLRDVFGSAPRERTITRRRCRCA